MSCDWLSLRWPSGSQGLRVCSLQCSFRLILWQTLKAEVDSEYKEVPGLHHATCPGSPPHSSPLELIQFKCTYQHDPSLTQGCDVWLPPGPLTLSRRTAAIKGVTLLFRAWSWGSWLDNPASALCVFDPETVEMVERSRANNVSRQIRYESASPLRPPLWKTLSQ